MFLYVVWAFVWDFDWFFSWITSDERWIQGLVASRVPKWFKNPVIRPKKKGPNRFPDPTPCGSWWPYRFMSLGRIPSRPSCFHRCLSERLDVLPLTDEGWYDFAIRQIEFRVFHVAPYLSSDVALTYAWKSATWRFVRSCNSQVEGSHPITQSTDQCCQPSSSGTQMLM